METLFALSNGYLGIRGTFDESTPSSNRGTFINGFYETWPLTYVEEGFGYAKTGQTIVNVPDATIIDVSIDGEALDVTSANIRASSRTLDLRAGLLTRRLVWTTASGAQATLESERLVSLAHRHLAAVNWTITVDRPARIEIASQLRDTEDAELTDATRHRDPRKARVLPGSALQSIHTETEEHRAVLSFRTKSSGLGLAAGMDHTVASETEFKGTTEVTPHGALVRFDYNAAPDVPFTISKFISYADGPAPDTALADHVLESLAEAKAYRFVSLKTAQEEILAEAWRACDVTVGSEPRIQQAVRWNLFHLIQATALTNGTGVAAKGVTSQAYGGHYFWDSEIYILPFLVFTNPARAARLLHFRHSLLDAARRRARAVDQEGALFPWRTINGEEASAYYPAGTAQYHINAAVMYGLRKYVEVTGDTDYLIEGGAEVLLETARLWADLGYYGARGFFHIDGVTGPDEYTALVDDNAYTNLMARQHLRYAVEVTEWLAAQHPEPFEELSQRIGLTPEEPQAWTRAADAMAVPNDPEAGILAQNDGFLDRELWDLAATPRDRFPLLLHYHPLVIYRHQVLKQPDVVLATMLLGDDFDLAQKRRNFDYYDPITTGDSSLSACVQSIMAAEVGHPELALGYFNKGLLTDLCDVYSNADDGVHLAAVGGVWMNLVYGFAGLRDYDGNITIDPKLPAEWTGLSFSMRVRGTFADVAIDHDGVTVTHHQGPELELTVAAQPVVIGEGSSQRVAIGS